MPLWVKFHLDDLHEALTEDAIRNVIRNLPRDLCETYARIIRKLHIGPGGAQKIEVMKKVVRWVVCARRPLRLDELEEAVGLEKSDTYLHAERSATHAGPKLISACGNLIIYSRDDDLVTLAHHTVQKFLCSSTTPEGISYPESVHFDLSTGDHDLGELCVAYPSFTDFETQLTKVPYPVTLD
ncbi:hypothetical protein BCR34DRAFT_336786 [Clohesyomyces aquaticus]|uniref:GPI inositol-deacylase winged helix domain-containing protein n=1 Tax=Clohesyomyces aquaticus TaxID=1231657 RepID=A0A1Y1ZL58_9PLEO|nr:hypothetical protein BCR34DRAFT_336786 [Clohesyomyces aquaticus]